MAKMTKQKILDYFNEINLMYNNGAMHDLLSRTLDELLENRPEIVRCKDCRYGEHVNNILGEDRYECHLPESYVISDLALPPEWYCADGEAKQGDG